MVFPTEHLLHEMLGGIALDASINGMGGCCVFIRLVNACRRWDVHQREKPITMNSRRADCDREVPSLHHRLDHLSVPSEIVA